MVGNTAFLIPKGAKLISGGVEIEVWPGSLASKSILLVTTLYNLCWGSQLAIGGQIQAEVFFN